MTEIERLREVLEQAREWFKGETYPPPNLVAAIDDALRARPEVEPADNLTSIVRIISASIALAGIVIGLRLFTDFLDWLIEAPDDRG